MNKVVISTIGTSFLTKAAESDWKKALNEYANFNAKDIPEEIKNYTEALGDKISSKLKNSSVKEIKSMSAELNGLLCLYNDDIKSAKRDLNFLLTTDTFLGKQTARIVSEYLHHNGIHSEIIPPPKLSTANEENFSEGIKWILKWSSETLESFREKKYQIIFNLTGGFKAIQGVMNSIGMFYADKIVYIFESSESNLIQIPRLPIKIDDNFFLDHSIQLALLNAGREYAEDSFTNYPEALFDNIDGKVILSVWGELLWSKTKIDIFAKELLDFPYLHYEDSFKRDFGNIVMKTEKVKIQETLAKVSYLLDKNDSDLSILKKDSGLLYENFTNRSVSGVPIGHFRVNQGDRISCILRNKKLHLRKYGRHDYVNDNP